MVPRLLPALADFTEGCQQPGRIYLTEKGRDERSLWIEDGTGDTGRRGAVCLYDPTAFSCGNDVADR